ncbi:hypothetical protein KAU11_03685, partial [Candidatus Babeliales bacterium]|nr:hypothetical protein [Candidatus Babeliales bacterium]
MKLQLCAVLMFYSFSMTQSLSAGFLVIEDTLISKVFTAQVLTSENYFVDINKIRAGTHVKSLGFGGSTTMAKVTRIAWCWERVIWCLAFHESGESRQLLFFDAD